jgi:hypothetical protein
MQSRRLSAPGVYEEALASVHLAGLELDDRKLLTPDF